MRIVSFIAPHQREVIEKILTHCGFWQQPTSRAPPPPHDHRQQSRRELHYVSDLEYLDDNPRGSADPRSP